MGVISLGGQSCYDPASVARDLLATDQPIDWLDEYQPNSFTCPVGPESGIGAVLLTRSALNALAAKPTSNGGLNGFYDLVFTGGGQTRTYKNLLIYHAFAIAPTARSALRELYLVELRDRRWLAQYTPINKAYNVRQALGITAAVQYYVGTLNLGVPWTWATMFADLWKAVGTGIVGAAPSLPFTPDGTPEDMTFYGDNAWRAVNAVLQRLSCAVRWTPDTDAFSVVQVGAADANATTALASVDAMRLWDDDSLESAIARLPQYVRVMFRLYPEPADGTSPWYVINIIDTSPTTGTQAGTYVEVRDDEIAQTIQGVVINIVALFSRAVQRGADWFRVRKSGQTRLHRSYRGALSAPDLFPVRCCRQSRSATRATPSGRRLFAAPTRQA